MPCAVTLALFVVLGMEPRALHMYDTLLLSFFLTLLCLVLDNLWVSQAVLELLILFQPPE